MNPKYGSRGESITKRPVDGYYPPVRNFKRLYRLAILAIVAATIIVGYLGYRESKKHGRDVVVMCGRDY